MSVDENKLSYSVSQAARLVGLTPPVLYKAINEGYLRYWQPHPRGDMRITRQHLEEWFNSRFEEAGADHV